MLRWTSEAGKTVGFNYIPLWEVAMGLFLFLVGIAVPTLFFRANGWQSQQWPEWLFLLVMVLVLGIIGYSLVFQKFQATQHAGRMHIVQTLRAPSVRLDLAASEIDGFSVDKLEDGPRPVFRLFLLRAGQPAEIYRSVNQKEAEELKKALEVLHRSL